MLAGDVKLAADTFNNFIAVWQKYGVIPERYHYLTAQMHPTERHYPLRPELMESALYLMQARQPTMNPPGGQSQIAWQRRELVERALDLLGAQELHSGLLDVYVVYTSAPSSMCAR